MKKKTIILITFLNFIFGFSQERKIEKIYNDCYFNSMPENGKEVKRLFENYEKLLLSKDILKNNSGESYFNLFKKVMSGEFMEDKTNFSLIDSVNKLEYSNLIHFNTKCTEKIKSLREYKKSNTYLLEKRMDSIKEDFTAEKASEIFLKTMNEKDFEIDFYKLRVLLLIEKTNSLIELEPKKIEYSKERIKSSLHIHLTEESKVLVNKNNISKEELIKKIESHLIENKKESLITIKISRKAMYSEYLNLFENIQLAFTLFKNKISTQYYNKTFENLNLKEKERIIEEYSFEINESEPE